MSVDINICNEYKISLPYLNKYDNLFKHLGHRLGFCVFYLQKYGGKYV